MKPKLAAAILTTAVVLTGCAGTAIGFRSGNPGAVRGGAPAPGTSYNSAAVTARVGSNGYFSLLFIGAMAAGVRDDYMAWGTASSARKPPELAEDRSIAERDCSQPMPQMSANLRCK